MKKALSLLLALVLCLSLCACSNGAQLQMPEPMPTLGSITPPTEEHIPLEEEPLIILDTENGYSLINGTRFDELVETVELTTENWMEHLAVWPYTHETVHKDAFGEIVSTETYTIYYLVAKRDQYYMFNDFVIELKHKTTGTLITQLGENEDGLGILEDFCIDEYECTRIEGTLSFVDIPDEVITVDPNTGVRIYRIQHSQTYIEHYRFGRDGRMCGLYY